MDSVVGSQQNEVGSRVEESGCPDSVRVTEAVDSRIVGEADYEDGVEAVGFDYHEGGGSIKGDAVGDRSKDGVGGGEGVEKTHAGEVVEEDEAVGLAKSHKFLI